MDPGCGQHPTMSTHWSRAARATGWGLMLLLFAGGVMNLMVIAALTLFVAFEKLTSFGIRGAQISGALLLAAGVWMLTR